MTNELRKIVLARLGTIAQAHGITDIGYARVKDDSLFPHLILDISSVTPTDMGRLDFLMDVHIWAKDAAAAFDIQDDVRRLFRFWNAPDKIPNQTIYPTFYEVSAGQMEDPDKTLVHLVLRMQGQVYDKDAADSAIIWRD